MNTKTNLLTINDIKISSNEYFSIAYNVPLETLNNTVNQIEASVIKAIFTEIVLMHNVLLQEGVDTEIIKYMDTLTDEDLQNTEKISNLLEKIANIFLDLYNSSKINKEVLKNLLADCIVSCCVVLNKRDADVALMNIFYTIMLIKGHLPNKISFLSKNTLSEEELSMENLQQSLQNLGNIVKEKYTENHDFLGFVYGVMPSPEALTLFSDYAEELKDPLHQRVMITKLYKIHKNKNV